MTALLAFLTELLVDGKLTADETRKILLLAHTARRKGTIREMALAAGVSASTYYRHHKVPS
jgi:hypothetical protein